jgi:hypothetical protein
LRSSHFVIVGCGHGHLTLCSVLLLIHHWHWHRPLVWSSLTWFGHRHLSH